MKVSTLHLALLFLLGVLQSVRAVTQLYAIETEATFSSQNYPSAYPLSTVQEWRITSNDTTKVIYLDVLVADIEYNTEQNDCSYDYVNVYDGTNTAQGLLGSFCGTDLPSFSSSSNNIYVYFKSDYSIPKTGFLIQYKAGAPVTEVNWRWIVGGICIALAVIGIVAGFVTFMCWNDPKALQVLPDRGTLYETPIHYKDPRKAPTLKVVVTTEDEVHDLKDLPDPEAVEETPVEPMGDETADAVPVSAENTSAPGGQEAKPPSPQPAPSPAPESGPTPDPAQGGVASPRRVSLTTPTESAPPSSDVELPEVVVTPPAKEV